MDEATREDPAAEWIPIGDLVPWDQNPRDNDQSVDEVAGSIRRFGFAAPIIARRADSMVIAGHTRLKAAQKLGINKVPVRWMDLDPAEARMLALADNKLNERALWDDSVLAEVLAELEAEGADLEGLGWDQEELDALIANDSVGDGMNDVADGIYTAKIQAPIYEPSGPKPAESDLYDTAKTDDLQAEILAAGLPAPVQKMLVAAACRHTSFSFRDLANYYAHSEADVQRLMERSALVIVDFESAIEQGFVRMTERLNELVEDEMEGAEGAAESDPVFDIVSSKRSLTLLSSSNEVVRKDLLKRIRGLGCDPTALEQSLKVWGNESSIYRSMYKRWYSSVEAKRPDFGVYGEDIYIAEAWDCWKGHSKKALKQLSGNVLEQIKRLSVQTVYDLGCGIGLTTSALAQMFDGCRIVGTNHPGTGQYRLAEDYGRSYGFELQKDIHAVKSPGPAMIFASEYFEHFEAPIDHLNDVLSSPNLVAIIFANTFNQPAIGHFPNYLIDSKRVEGRTVGRSFSKALKAAGFSKVNTGFWNNRPGVWIKHA